MPVDKELLRFIAALRTSWVDMEYLFTNGQCYNFALIVRSIRPQAVVHYDQVEGHVYVEVGGRLYDIRGVLPLPAHRYPGIPVLDHKRGHKPHRWGPSDTRRCGDKFL